MKNIITKEKKNLLVAVDVSGRELVAETRGELLAVEGKRHLHQVFLVGTREDDDLAGTIGPRRAGRVVQAVAEEVADGDGHAWK